MVDTSGLNLRASYATPVIRTAPVAAGSAARHAGPLPGWLLVPVAVGGGLLASAAYAPYGLWPLAFVAVAALAWVTARARRLSAAVGLGYAFGVAFMGTSLVWQASILAASYVGLTLVTAFVYAAIAGTIRVVRRLPAAPLWQACAWGLGEWVISVFPFEGFGWMRLGYAMPDSPLAGYYPFAGAAFVSFLVALIGHLLARIVLAPGRRRAAGAVAAVTAILAVGGLGTEWDAPRETLGSVEVGWVQGGAPGGGVYGLGPARTITTNQSNETGRLAADVAAGVLPAPDFVVWPENSTDLDPRSDARTRALVQEAADAVGVPLLVGSIYTEPDREERRTVAVWWNGTEPTVGYTKRNLTPFGEWIPLRTLLLPLIPELRYVGYDSVPGVTPGAFDATLPDGRRVRLGVAICYEVIFPETLYEAREAGAQVMFVQSSNAMFQGTAQIDQQFAITRVRAAEMRTEILVVTTSGVSGRIGSHGEVVARYPDGIGAHGVETLTLTHATTPVMVVGRLVEALVVLFGAVALAISVLGRLRAQRDGRMDDASAPNAGG